MIGCGGSRAEHRFARRIHGYAVGHRDVSYFLGIYLDRGPGHGLCARKCMLRNGRHSALDIAVYVGDVGYVRSVFVDDGGVVNVRDGGRVYSRVADVDAVHVLTADLIRRYINFARTEREPSDVSTETASTADENHERGRVDGMHFHRALQPIPSGR